MDAEIYSGNMRLGTVRCENLDCGVGIALGPFVPSEDYDADLHASTIDGNFAGYKGESFLVLIDGTLVQSKAVDIQDFTESLQEIQVVILFADAKEYEAIFKDHPQYW